MTFLLTTEKVVALALITLGSYVILYNWLTLIKTRQTGRFHSAVPILGALFLAIGLALLPSTRHYAWVTFLIDYGTLILLYALPRILREAWATSKRNLIAEYEGGQGIMSARISLYRGGVCLIKQEMKHASGELGMVSMSNSGTWSRDEQWLSLQVGETSARFDVVSKDGNEVLRQTEGFSWDRNEELSLTGVDLRRRGGVTVGHRSLG